MTETPKWTEGPWTVLVSEGILIAKEDDYADGHNHMAIAVASRHGLIGHNEALANAHLIASAPTMAEALQDIIDAHDNYCKQMCVEFDDPLSDAIVRTRSLLSRLKEMEGEE